MLLKSRVDAFDKVILIQDYLNGVCFKSVLLKVTKERHFLFALNISHINNAVFIWLAMIVKEDLSCSTSPHYQWLSIVACFIMMVPHIVIILDKKVLILHFMEVLGDLLEPRDESEVLSWDAKNIKFFFYFQNVHFDNVRS